MIRDEANQAQLELNCQIIARNLLRKTETPWPPGQYFLAISDSKGYINYIHSRPEEFPLPQLLIKDAPWSCEAIGANGLDLALSTGQSVAILGHQHSLAQLGSYFSIGTPIFLSPDQPVGALVILGKLGQYDPRLIGWLEEFTHMVQHRLTADRDSRSTAQSMLIHENIRLLAASGQVNADLGIIIVNPHNQLVQANPVAQALLGKEQGEYLVSGLSPFEDEILELTKESLAISAPCFREIPASTTGTTSPVLVSSQPLKNALNESTIGVMLVLYDLHHALQQFPTTFQALTHLEDDLVVLDKEGRIVFGNRFSEEDTGQYYIDVVFKGEKYRGDGEHNSLLIQALEKGTDAISKVYQTPDGQHTRRTDIRLLRDEAGEVAGVVGIRKDITEEQMLKNQLVHSERLSVIGELAAQTIHELRNPLAAIRASAQLALWLDPDEKDATLRQIMKEIDKINDFVSNLLMLAKPTKTSYQPENLAKIVDSVLDLVKAKTVFKNTTVEQNYTEDGLQPIKASTKLLEQALINVINNALDAMDDDGKLTLAIIEHSERDCQELIVSDTGKGIPADEITRLFQPFYTTKGDSGTGLGLAITKRIITESHQGRIWIESEVGRGTQVHIELPIIDRSM